MVFLLIVQMISPLGQVFAAESGVPANLQATQTYPGDIRLQWTAVTGANHKVYNVTNGQKTLVGETKYNFLTIKDLAEGSYQFAISAVVSGVESSLSTPVSVEVVYPDMQSPANVKVSVTNGNNLYLSWDSVTYATDYHIYQVIDGQKQLVKTVQSNGFSFTNLPEGTYSYEVSSFNADFGESATSKISYTLVHPDVQAPAGFTVTVKNGNDLSLRWNESTFATAYNLYKVENGVKTLVKSTPSTTFTITSAPEGQYNFELVAYSDRFGEGATSSKASLNLEHPEMKAPANVKVNVRNGNDLAIIWDPSEFATAYDVYQIEAGQKKLLGTVTGSQYVLTNKTEGTYAFEVYAVSDRFGKSATASKVEHNLVFPQMQAPTNARTKIVNVSDVGVFWDPAEFATKHYVYEVIDGEDVLLGETTSRSFTVRKLTEGTHTFKIKSYSDRFGTSVEAAETSAVIDYPELVAPALSLQKFDGQNAKLVWNTVSVANYYNVYEIINGKEVFVKKTTGNTIELSDMETGYHEFAVRAGSDLLGLSELSNTVSFTVLFDILAPKTVSDNSLISWTNKDVTVNLTATDDKSGLDKTFYLFGTDEGTVERYEGTNFTFTEEGLHTYSFYSIDKSGNKEVLKTELVKIDKTAPTSSVESKTDQLSKRATIKFNVEDELSGPYSAFYSFNGEDFRVGETVIITESGVHTVYFYGMDKAGNKDEIKSVQVTVDGEAPVTEHTILNQQEGQFSVELNATDDISGVRETYYSIDGNDFVVGTEFDVIGKGYHKIEYFSVDQVGNVEDIQSFEILVDDEAPVTTHDVEDKWNNHEVNVTLTATDDASGVKATYFALGDAEFVEGTTLTISDQGTHLVRFYSVDNAGNVEKEKSVEVKIDLQAPVTTHNATNEWANGEFALELDAKDNLSGVEKTYYSIDGAEFVEGAKFGFPGNGVFTVEYYSVDTAGNVEETKTVQVKVDDQAPVTTDNVKDQWATEDVVVELTANDNLSGVKATYFSIDGADFAEGTTLTVSGEGTHKVAYYSVDNAGNIEDVNTVEVKIDLTAPVTTSNVEEKWNKEAVTVQLTATDDLSGVSQTFYSIDGSEFVEGAEFVVEGEGIHQVTYYSKDVAGNVEEVNTVEVKIDLTAPELTADFADSFDLGSEIAFDFESSDNLSGIALEIVTFNGQTYAKGDKVTLDTVGEYTVLVTATDNAGWETTYEKTISVIAPPVVEPPVVTPPVVVNPPAPVEEDNTCSKEEQSGYSFGLFIGIGHQKSNNGLHLGQIKQQYDYKDNNGLHLGHYKNNYGLVGLVIGFGFDYDVNPCEVVEEVEVVEDSCLDHDHKGHDLSKGNGLKLGHYKNHFDCSDKNDDKKNDDKKNDDKKNNDKKNDDKKNDDKKSNNSKEPCKDKDKKSYEEPKNNKLPSYLDYQKPVNNSNNCFTNNYFDSYQSLFRW